MSARDRIAVLGGGGFLGRRIVSRLVQQGRRVVVCERDPPASVQSPASDLVAIRTCDIRDKDSARRIMCDCSGAINCVGLYREAVDCELTKEHVRGARNVGEAAAECGVGYLGHVSVMGADPDAQHDIARAECYAELAALEAFPAATILRPSIMFGAKDGFISRLVRLISQSSAVPIPSPSDCGVQPIFVDDVAAAAVAASSARFAAGARFELPGPETLTFAQIVRQIGYALDRHPHLIPLPDGAMTAIGWATSWLKDPLFTPAQLELFRRGTRPVPGLPGLAALKIEPVSLRRYLANDMPVRSEQAAGVSVP